MAHVKEHVDVEFENPLLVEGLPGVGLVGKIAADHLVDEFDMDLYATVHCESLAPVAVYHDGERDVQPPVRIYAAPDADLLVLQSDVPVNAEAVREFADCFTAWLSGRDVTAVYLSGMAAKKGDSPPAMHGVGTGEGGARLEELGVDLPSESGVISGPTGALVNRAAEEGLDSVALVVESDPQFPDPEASRVLIEHGISPLVDVEVSVEDLVEHAEDIREKKEQLAAKMQQAKDEETSQAQPLRMYQ
ncbi:proteasome assembly chaperone family protein [Halorubellus sp. JP-L1]|uniref:proteasome assembly chaperone family protein n=1 Tax=Halorubellus sp. JP-L1 TaxID=2715753 RepID=UPI00140D6D6B|nr:PAC2 family protein [Halorubellus sp. JP-L1]NHN42496.1 proteasome assembly chaperone family protein [Halorubellus sp. JP-L1]